MFEVCRTPPLLEQHETAIVDSGCTGHFLLVTAPCLNKVISRNPLTVRLPNGVTMESSHTADFDIPGLKAAASKAHVFPGMAHHFLLSVGQLCDEGYIVTFRQDTVKICNYDHSKLLSGPGDVTTGLWRINLKQPNKKIPNPIANNVYELRNTGALVHKAPNSRQQGIDRFKEFLHPAEYQLSTGSAPLSSTQRCGTRHQDFQGTLCGRALLS
jgi:hypothetical protein